MQLYRLKCLIIRYTTIYEIKAHHEEREKTQNMRHCLYGKIKQQEWLVFQSFSISMIVENLYNRH